MASLVLTFEDPNQTVMTEPGALCYVRGPMRRGEVQLEGGIMAGLGRKLAGQTFFANQYALREGAAPGTKGKVVLGASYPGGVLRMDIKPGEEYIASRGSLLAWTSGVQVRMRVKLSGLVPWGTDEGFVLPKVSLKQGVAQGTVWLASYGSLEVHDLAQGEELLVDNGLMLAMPASAPFERVKLGRGWASTILGGEGLGMRFVGPMRICTQSKRIEDFAHVLEDYLPDRG